MTNKAQQIFPALLATLILFGCKGEQSLGVNKTPDSDKASSVAQSNSQPSNGQLEECRIQLFGEPVSQKDAAFNCANIYPENPHHIFIDNKTTATFVRELKKKIEEGKPTESTGNKKVLPFLLPLQTILARYSRAHLQFNEGSAFRAAVGAEFNFKPDLRRSIVQKGGVLFMLPNIAGLGNFKTSVETSEQNSEHDRTVYIVRRNAEQKRTVIYALTEGPVRVTAKGKTVELRAGESVIATQAGLEEKQQFDICQFYFNEDLVRGLGPWKRDLDYVSKLAPSLQRTYHTVRSETVPVYWQLCVRKETRVVYEKCPPQRE